MIAIGLVNNDLMSHPQIDMQDIAREHILPVQNFLNVPKRPMNQKKPQRMQWRPQYELIEFTIPSHVNSASIKRKFKIIVDCYDTKTMKSFSKTIFFGDQNDFIFTGDKTQRLKKMMSLKNKDNPLHSDYWRAHLCFASSDFKQNCKKMINFLLNKRFGDQAKVGRVIESAIGPKKKQ